MQSQINGGCGCYKTPMNKFLDPCLTCPSFCNCDFLNEYPDIVVRSSDRAEILLSSFVVSGSPILQELVKKRGYNMLLANDGSEEFPTWADSLSPGPKTASGPKEEEEEDEYDSKQIVDLRPDNTKEATLQISKKLWRFFEKFMSFHLDEMEERMSAKKRFQSFVRRSPNVKIPGQLAGGEFECIGRHCRFYSYQYEEERMFGNLEVADLLPINQMTRQLQCVDLHYTLEKWVVISQIRPNIEDFGWKVQFSDEYALQNPSQEGREIRRFVEHAVSRLGGIRRFRGDDPSLMRGDRGRRWRSTSRRRRSASV